MECDGCTLCCKLFKIPWMDSPEGDYCKECEPNIGCKIWENRPEKCRPFECVYYKIKDISTDFRPDKCGIVFEMATDKIVYGTLDIDFVMSDLIREQIHSFLKKGISVVLRHLYVPAPIVFNTEDRTTEDVWKELKEAAWRHQSTLQT